MEIAEWKARQVIASWRASFIEAARTAGDSERRRALEQTTIDRVFEEGLELVALGRALGQQLPARELMVGALVLATGNFGHGGSALGFWPVGVVKAALEAASLKS